VTYLADIARGRGNPTIGKLGDLAVVFDVRVSGSLALGHTSGCSCKYRTVSPPTRQATDAELLQACKTEPDAFAVFYDRYERLVAGWLMRRTGQPEVAADLAAEVFAAAYLASDRFRIGDAPTGAWLLGIARNKLREAQRRARTELAAHRRLELERVVFSEDELDRLSALQHDVVAWLEDLPEDQREAVRAYVLEDEDYAAIAVRTRISTAAARKRVSRGLALLRHRMNQEG
jgi:RNA polymerase sigma factor (sigma-70 family)